MVLAVFVPPVELKRSAVLLATCTAAKVVRSREASAAIVRKITSYRGASNEQKLDALKLVVTARDQTKA